MGFYMSDLRILVVEDREEAREMICTMLSHMGVGEIYDTHDGESALECFETMKNLSGAADIVFCDWNMPGISGVDVLKHLRTIDPTLPFVMITGRGDRESVKEAKKSGASGHILKPFTPEQLEAKIRIVMQKRARVA